MKMEIIPYDNRFLTRLTKVNFEPCYKKLICDYNVSELVLSFKFDYDTYKSYIVISNCYIKYGFETPTIATVMSRSYDTAIVCAGNQQQIDLWLNILKESLECYLPTYFCRNDIRIKIQNACIYKDTLYFLHKFSNDNRFYFIAHPYLIVNHPDVYKEIKETEYADYNEMSFYEFKARYTEFMKKHNINYFQK